MNPYINEEGYLIMTEQATENGMTWYIEKKYKVTPEGKFEEVKDS